ncbi:hypothetical protein B484DRAFT_416639 [Ochromonadaceae sp. CCMP2298]|nr:hypothetical protein B484DRAFT_416639 [Ochromonadaceae sp. CCMP2298]
MRSSHKCSRMAQLLLSLCLCLQSGAFCLASNLNPPRVHAQSSTQLRSHAYEPLAKEQGFQQQQAQAQAAQTRAEVEEHEDVGQVWRPFPQIRNLYERLSYSWVQDLMRRGNAAPLQLGDLWLLPEKKRMRNSSEVFERLLDWEIEQEAQRLEVGKGAVGKWGKGKGAKRKGGNVLVEFWASPVTRAVVKMYRREFVNSGLLKFVNTCVQFTPSLIVARILKHVGALSTSTGAAGVGAGAGLGALAALGQVLRGEGVQLCALLFLSLCVKTALENQYFDLIARFSAEIRGTLSAAIYRKSLRMSPASRANHTLGEVVNYMQLDTSRMEYVAGTIHTVWDGLLQIIGYTGLLLWFLGPSMFAGIAAMVVILPLNAHFLISLSKLKELNLALTDRRVKLTNEVLQGIRAIKSYNWEAPFSAQLDDIRKQELECLKKAANIRAVLVSTLSTAPSLVAVASLSVYALLGNELNPTKVFTSLALFNQLRFPLIFFPMLLNTLAEGRVSLRRLTTFLLTEEVQNYVSDCEPEGAGEGTGDVVRISNGSFSWSSRNQQVSALSHDAPQAGVSVGAGRSGITGMGVTEGGVGVVGTGAGGWWGGGGGGAENRDRLVGVDLAIKRGELVAVVGPTGSGKSTLLNALLGELGRDEGTVMVQGRVAYVPQSSWIPNGSLRDVILFGRSFDAAKYANAVRMCGLERDLELLEAGDMTEIGERGINLSGGQKQRVSMARAVYDDADVYLLDDPLSALDTEVGSQLFSSCIRAGLGGKTRILVTHQLGVLRDVDRIVIMEQTDAEACRVLDQGTWRELVGRGHDLARYVKSDVPEVGVEEVEEHEKDVEEVGEEVEVKGEHGLSWKGVGKGFGRAQARKEKEREKGKGRTELEGGPDKTEGASHSDSMADSMGGAVNGVGLGGGGGVIADLGVVTSNSTSEVEAASLYLGAMPPTGGLLEVGELAEDKHTDEFEEGGQTVAVSLEEVGVAMDMHTVAGVAEERAQGSVGLHVYRAYVAAADKPFLLGLVLISFVFANASQILQQWVVAAWTSDVGYVKRPLAAYMGGVGAMASMVALFSYLRTYLGAFVGAAASQAIHTRMIQRVLGAPLSFFESTPVGRLVQRFSKDLDQIDQQLPNSIGQLLSSSLSILGSIVAIMAVTPSFGVAMIGITAVYLRITNYYRNVARELKRLDALSRSPIYTHFSETLGGLPIIRSFKKQPQYLRQNELRLDDNISSYNTLKLVDRWLSVRLELLGNAIVLFSSLLAVATRSRAGPAGLSLNNALGVTGLLNWAVRNAAETEALMNSVERVTYTIEQTPQEALQYVKSIDAFPEIPGFPGLSGFKVSAYSEPEFPDSVFPAVPLDASHHSALPMYMGSATSTITSTSTSASTSDVNASDATSSTSDRDLLSGGWPWRGGITFEDVHMRYREDFEPVLRGVQVSIQPGERVGIVGRTGSGKSSLFRALLRLTEVDSGRISIDGVDVGLIGLDALRSSLSVIPQDPVLFSGSIRFNLDPFRTHSDAELWAALHKSNLHRTVMSLPGGLGYEVTEGGDNFSAGQKQLLCLARALVRKSKLLLLDEATSSVDYLTDALIQQTIRSEFGDGTTVLTIAHRLDTIMDADKILVMDAGKLGEMCTPAELLANPQSLFSQLVAAEQKQMSTSPVSAPASASASAPASAPAPTTVKASNSSQMLV